MLPRGIGACAKGELQNGGRRMKFTTYCEFAEGDVYAYSCYNGVHFYVSGREKLNHLCRTFVDAHQYALRLRERYELNIPDHAIKALLVDALEESFRTEGPDSTLMRLSVENDELRQLLYDMWDWMRAARYGYTKAGYNQAEEMDRRMNALRTKTIDKGIPDYMLEPCPCSCASSDKGTENNV